MFEKCNFIGFITSSQLLEEIDNILFREESTLTISVLRVLTGILVLIETLVWQGRNKVLLTPKGWFSFKEFENSRHRFSLLYYLPSTEQSLNLIFAIQFISALCLVLGIASNLAALVCFITLVSIHNRNIYVLSSGDTVYRFFCLFLVFAPLNSQLRLLNFPNLIDDQAYGWSWVLLLIRLFIANIYLKNVLFKLLGNWWREGTATEKVLHVRIWNRFKLPLILDKKWFFKFTTYFTLLVETSLFSLVWIDDFRPVVLLVGVFFHMGLWVFLRFGFFQLTMIFGLATFIEPEEYKNLFAIIIRTFN